MKQSVRTMMVLLSILSFCRFEIQSHSSFGSCGVRSHQQEACRSKKRTVRRAGTDRASLALTFAVARRDPKYEVLFE
jgi:hypothetical protein